MTRSEHDVLDWLAPLAPARDRLRVARSPALAGAAGAWGALLVVDEAPVSQYDALLERSRRQGPPPAAVAALALTGRDFHGNRGRAWQAVRGNLHLSCLLPVDLPAATCAPAVPAVAALAVCEAVRSCAPAVAPRVKWVNDVLLDGAKAAGVLSAAQSRGERMTSLAYGIGVNVAVAPPVPATVFVPRVTSLAAQGGRVGLGVLAAVLLGRIRRHVDTLGRDGPEAAVAGYRQACDDVGRRVVVYAEGTPDTDDPAALPPPLATGRVRSLDAQLALVVEGMPAPLTGGRLRRLDDAD